jgi:hypothetical protein
LPGEAFLNRRRTIQELVTAEARDPGARKELYKLMHFRSHPAPRIALTLAQAIQGRDCHDLVKAFSPPTGRDLWGDRLELMLRGDRGAYRRARGYAAYVIDRVAYRLVPHFTNVETN